MIDTIDFKGEKYPLFQTEGPASQFIKPFAVKVCKGVGYDIGCKHKCWALPGSVPIDLRFNDGWYATRLPDGQVDYIFSSHCLEHIFNWVGVLDYWTSKLKKGGVLFLYLPCYSQHYWRPWNNSRHKHVLTPTIIEDYMKDKGYENVFKSGQDLYNSFAVMGELA